jgi:hypothetical protein
MLKEIVTEDLVHCLPVAGNETLLVEIDEVALHYFVLFLLDTIDEVVSHLVALALL